MKYKKLLLQAIVLATALTILHVKASFMNDFIAVLAFIICCSLEKYYKLN